MSGCVRAIRLATALEFFENTDQLGGIASLQQELYSFLGKLEFPQALLDSGPEPVAFLSFGKEEVCCQLRKALKLDGVEVFVVSIDDLSLVRRVVGHSTALLAFGLGQPAPAALPLLSGPLELLAHVLKSEPLARARSSLWPPASL
jgi:hypothetical protein